MTRRVERWEGLSLPGEAVLGAVRLRVPVLLEATGPGTVDPSPGAVTLTERPGAPTGRRYLRVGTDPPLDLDLPIAAPELAGPATDASEVVPGIGIVRGPLRLEELGALRARGPWLVILSNARQLFAEGEPFLQALAGIHAAFGGGAALWAPRVALPHRIPLLAYLGVDLMDTTEGLLESLHGVVWDESLGGDRVEKEARGTGTERTVEEYRRALTTTRIALERGRLRELVEARTTAEPALGEMLRHADRLLGALLEERAPVVGGHALGRYVVAESIRRPEMRRFRERLITRYRPPPSKEVLLLLPCSRTKPYRTSRSHRRFARAWEGVPYAERLHVVSISSPIGVVPRELEDVYPARHYDIPVTGEWSAEEREVVLRGLRHLLREGRYRNIIVHLDPTEYGFLRDALGSARPTVFTLGDSLSTSEEAIASLRTAITESLADATPLSGGPLTVVREELHEIAAWQFGRIVADRLFERPLRLAGRPWFQRLTDGAGTDLASWREERGLFHLTAAGAERIEGEGAPTVEADPRVPLTGDLFVPGVLASDPSIRAGDVVLVRRNGTLSAVGEAALPGPLMTTLGHGLAVRLRHRVARSTDTPLMGRDREAAGPVV